MLSTSKPDRRSDRIAEISLAEHVITSMNQSEKVWQIRADLRYRKLVDGGMLYDSEKGEVHHFNATAARVWEACQGGEKISQVVEDLCRAFAVDRARAQTDVEKVLKKFIRAGLFLS